MKTSWLWIVLAVSLGINVGILGTLAVQGSDKDKGSDEKSSTPSIDDRSGPIADRLGLEGEDREKFIQLQRGLLESTQGHREEIEAMRREVQKELREDEPDRDRIDNLIADMTETSAAQEREYVETVLATRELLDDEQQAMYQQFLAQIRARSSAGGRPGVQQQRFRPGAQQQRMAPGAGQQRVRPGAQQQRMRPGGQAAPGGPQASPQEGQEQQGDGQDGEDPGGG